jgi:type VI secretion system secreted protein Hcp
MSLRAVCTLVVAVSLCVLAPAANAAVDMFLEIDGIQGESRDNEFANQIDVLAWSNGVSSSKVAKAAANFQQVSVTKYTDRSSPELLQDVASGKVVSFAKLHIRKAGTAPLEYLRFCYTGVQFTSLSMGGSGGEDRLTENLTFSYQKITERYVQQNAAGQPGATFYGGWDLVSNVQFGGPQTC